MSVTIRYARTVVLLVAVLLSSALLHAADATHSAVARFSPEAASQYLSFTPHTVTDDAEIVILEYQRTLTFDAQGNYVENRYIVYKVLNAAGAENWASFAVEWDPWHEERPRLRARVLTPDKAVHQLDSKTITDAPARDQDDSVFTDRRVLRAPLPAVAPGAIVEEEQIISVKPIFAGAGTLNRSFLGQDVPVEHARITLEMPATLPLHYALQLLPDVTPQRSEANGTVTVAFDRGPNDAFEVRDTHLPSDVPGYPNLTFSTAASWQSVALGFDDIVEAQIAHADLRALVDKLTAGKTTREQKAAALLDYVNREVRYTGVEFGDAAVVPRPPAETLTRKYGDCKDKAALLVALLRSAGVPAYIALLNAGGRQDLLPDLPGADMFDHAIVYAPGSPDFWIDSTDEYARLGQVPSGDQERYALIARPETTSLVRTPSSTSADNKIVERREVFLADFGPARIVETSQPYGAAESAYRHHYADLNAKNVQESLTEYVKTEYLADKLDHSSRTKPEDLSTQFELVLESKRARRGYTDLNSAVVAVRTEELFDQLPEPLRVGNADDNGASGADTGSQPAHQRSADWQIVPSAKEWQYIITPPAGFRPTELPKSSKRFFGPAVLTEEFTASPDGVVHATVSFDTVKRRMTASEADAMRKEVVAFQKEEPIVVRFEPQGQLLIADGKVREAVQSYRQLISLHSDQALPHLRFADALIAAGLGETARIEARKAVALEPNSALAQRTLGDVLQYDVVGRRYRPGSDFAGSEAALRAAIRIDPDDSNAAGDLALLLEYNKEGVRYGDGARLKEAIAEYQKLGDKKLASLGLSNNIAFALLYDRQFAAARKAAETLNPPSATFIVASEAASHGSASAIAEAHRRESSPQGFSTTVSNAAATLLKLQLYAPAADLYEAAATGSNASQVATLATLLRSTVPHASIAIANDPKGVVQQSLMLMGDTSLTRDKLDAISSRAARYVMDHESPEKIAQDLQAPRKVRSAFARTGLPPEALIDIMLTMVQPTVVGDDQNGYRASFTLPGSKTMVMYIVKEDGNYKFLDSSDNPDAIGLEALNRVKAGNLEGARILLDWVREEQHLSGGDDPMVGYVFPRFWTQGKSADAAQMKLAAAALMVRTKATAPLAVPILEEALRSASDPALKTNLSLALAAAYGVLLESEKQLPLVSALAAQYPESASMFHAEVKDLNTLGRFDQANALAQARLQRLPGDLDAMHALVGTAIAREDYASVRVLQQKVLDSGKAVGGDYNNAAWYALFAGNVGQADLDNALKATQLNQNDTSKLHTLGCLYAELGKTKEARAVLIQAMDLGDLDEPEPEYWYAFGRIAEQYGLPETAVADYTRVTRPEHASEIPGSSYRLATIRLKAMNPANAAATKAGGLH